MLRGQVLATHFSKYDIFCWGDCATAAHAQSAARVNLPFDFTAARQHFAGGYYDIIMDANLGFITLVSEEKVTKRIRMIVGSRDAEGPSTLLRFDVCGEEHVLRNIQMDKQVTTNLDAPNGQMGGVPCVSLKY